MRSYIWPSTWFITAVPFVLILAMFMLAARVLAAPAPKTPPPANPQAAEKTSRLSGPSNWGKVVQTERVIEISGHDMWYALGEIRADGKVQLVWTNTTNGDLGIGVYAITNDGSMTGEWQYGSNCFINAIGDLEAVEGQSLLTDRVYRIKPGESDTPEPFR